MTGSLILNENNLSPTGVFDASVTPGPYNKFTVNLRGFNVQGRRIGLKKLNMYYSWPNIVAGATTAIQWPVGAGYSTFNWALPASTNYKSALILNDSLQAFCITNGLYLINSSTGDFLYYIALAANETTYKLDLVLSKVPTSLPAGYTAPSNWAGYPTTSKTMRFTLSSGSELLNIMGFAPATYDGGLTATTFSSNFVPQFNPVSCVYVTCNIAKNDLPINGSTVISTFTTRGTDYGAMIELQNQDQIDFYEIDTNSNTVIVQFFDQNWNALPIQDPQTTIHLVVA
jgi:hypothetical protein